METIDRLSKKYLFTPEKTVPQKCTEYLTNNPTQVANGVVIGMVGWYTLPIVYSIVSWVPYIGIGYYTYHHASNSVQVIGALNKGYKWSRKLYKYIYGYF